MLELPEKDPCPFCEIVAGRAETWNVVAETELTLTILNGRQFEVGQCLVMPRRHAPTLLDLEDAESAAVMAAARRLMQVMLDSFEPEGVLLYQNNGVGSGQEVPHFHLHVVPRREGSDWGLGPPHIARLRQERSGPRFDYEDVTDDKRETAAALRRHFHGPRRSADTMSA